MSSHTYYAKLAKKIALDKRKDDNLINWNSIDNNRLIKALMVIRTPDLMRLFLDDLLTKSEIEQCIRRLHAVELILMGAPYVFVRQSTGLGPSTIARISKQLIYKKGGYQEIMDRLHPNGFRYFD